MLVQLIKQKIMKKVSLLLLASVFSLSIYSCRETTEERTEDSVEEFGTDVEESTEEFGEDVEESVDEFGNEIDQTGEEIENEIDQEVDATDDVQ